MIADTSRASVAQISNPLRKSMGDMIESVVAKYTAPGNGHRDMTMREIKAGLATVFERDVDLSTISARVNELVAAKRLVRDAEHTRACTVTGVHVAPLSLPPEQGRLYY